MTASPNMAPEYKTNAATSNRSRSDRVMVAVGFSPRSAAAIGPRRVATLENPAPQFMRRYATRPVPASHRGLKPTATFALSLRDAVFALSLREESRRDSIAQPRVGAPAPTLGASRQRILQLQRGCSLRSLARARWDATLSGLSLFPRLTQGSSRTRNPGLDDGIPLGFLAGWNPVGIL